MTKGLVTFLVAIMLVLSAMSVDIAHAHQQKAAESTVLFNKRSGHLEIMHRFYMHDTEHAVQVLFDKHADIIDSKKTQQQFADYVAKQFFARKLDDTALTLKNVGYEVEGKFFWVYQEATLSTDLEGLKLFNGTLRELWPTQINMVNIEGKGEVRTLNFRDNEDWLTVNF